VKLPVYATVDTVNRRRTANNHSATHLMHAALRQVLGTHVEQKGSLVDENRLRFDFTHFSRLSREEIRMVEALVNQKIRENIPITEHRSIPITEAKEMGAMALFGEKYGDHVRVIAFDPGYSVELCGGTHVPATGQIGLFKILSDSAIAAGIRRIEAVTAEKAEEYWISRDDLLMQISEQLKNPKELLKSVSGLVAEVTTLRQQVAELGRLKLQQVMHDLKQDVKSVNGLNLLTAKIDLDAESLKNLAYELSKSVPSLYLVLAGEESGKAILVVMVADELVRDRKLHAGNIIRELAREIGGGGGGQPHIATAGGKNPEGIPAALRKAAVFAEG